MQCVILAGGLGTRMRTLLGDQPKTLVPVLGQPFAAYQLDWLARQGITEVVYCLGHQGSAVRAFVGDGQDWQVSVTYVDEGDNLRGTAGALRLAFDAGVLRPEFFVLYGDSFLRVELRRVNEAFARSGRRALMVVLRNDNRWVPSNVVYDKATVVLYNKNGVADRAGDMVYVDYGVSVLCRDLIGERIPAGVVADLSDVLRDLSREGGLAGFEATERFFEVGSPDGLRELEQHLGGAVPATSAAAARACEGRDG